MRRLASLLPLLLSWNLALRLPLLGLAGLLALCRLLSPLLRSTVRGALSLGLLALLRSRWNNTLTAEAHTLLLWLLLLLGRKRLPPLLTRRLLLAGNGSVSLLSPLLRCGLLLLWPLSPLLWRCQRCTLRCRGLSPLLRCRLLLLLLGPLSPLLRGRLGRGGLGRLRLRPLLRRALPRLRLSSWCLGRLSLGSLSRSSWCRSNWRRGRGRCSRLLFHVGLCLCGFSCRLYRRCRLVRCLSFRLRNRRMAGGRRL